MATMRNLPDSHPVFKIIRPHFRYTMAINSRGRATLMNNGGVIDNMFAIGTAGKIELYRCFSAVYSIHSTNIVRNCKERGVHDTDALPGYYYRDDGVKLWKAMEAFIGELIDEFYKTDQEVQNDPELQSWANDIHTNGFPGYYGAKDGHDFPNKITSKDELKEVCTTIMFTGSAQHASVNFGQYDVYAFVPNAPATLRLPPPTVKGKSDYATVMATLPNEDNAGSQVAAAHLLTRYSEDEVSDKTGICTPPLSYMNFEIMFR